MSKVIKSKDHDNRNKGKVKIPDVVFPEEKPSSPPPVPKEPPLPKPEVPKAPPEPIIKTVYRDPPPLTREEIAEQYAKEIEEICQEAKQQAYQEAYKDAYAQKTGEIEGCMDKVKQTLDQMQAEHQTFMEDYIRALGTLSTEVAETFVHQKIEEDDRILLPLIKSVIRDTQTTGWLNLELSDRLVHLTDLLKESPPAVGTASQVAITPVPADVDTVRVVTEQGAVDASISEQAKNLKQNMQDK